MKISESADQLTFDNSGRVWLTIAKSDNFSEESSELVITRREPIDSRRLPNGDVKLQDDRSEAAASLGSAPPAAPSPVRPSLFGEGGQAELPLNLNGGKFPPPLQFMIL